MATKKEVAEYNLRKNRSYTIIYLSVESNYRHVISYAKDSEDTWDILKDYLESAS